jgi:hypothetical protein
MGNFLAHCGYYPVSDKKDSMVSRLQPTTLLAVQAAFSQIVANADPKCREEAQSLQVSIPSLQNATFRMALYPYLQNAMKVLNEYTCDAKGKGLDDESYEDFMRSQFEENGRPTFGLEDVQAQCSVIQGNTVDEDQQLAQYIISTAGNLANLQQVKLNRTNLENVLKCGDLEGLAAMQQMFQALPWLMQKVLTSRNIAMTKEIQKAVAQNPGKVVMIALGALHYVDMGTSLGVVSLLKASGYKITRLHDKSPLNCYPSTNQGKGAADHGLCLAPPLTKQPESCLAFTLAFEQKIKTNKLYGRIRDESACVQCSNSSGACDCTVKWSNTSAFEKLCSEPINGTTGHVLDMDLTRNPSSLHTDTVMAQKTIRSMTQECYATTCNVAYLEEMALGGWYSKYGNLAEGKVTLREASSSGAPAASPGSVLNVVGSLPNSPSGGDNSSTFRWLMCIIGALVVVLISIVCTLAFMAKKKGNKTRAVRSASVDEEESDEEGHYEGSPRSSAGSSMLGPHAAMLDHQYQQQVAAADHQFQQQVAAELIAAEQKQRSIAERQEEIRMIQKQAAEHAQQHAAAQQQAASPLRSPAVGTLFAIPGLKGYMQKQDEEWNNMRRQHMESFSMPTSGGLSAMSQGGGGGYAPVASAAPAPYAGGAQESFSQVGQQGSPFRGNNDMFTFERR